MVVLEIKELSGETDDIKVAVLCGVVSMLGVKGGRVKLVVVSGVAVDTIALCNVVDGVCVIVVVGLG